MSGANIPATYTPAQLRNIAGYQPDGTASKPALTWAADEIDRLTELNTSVAVESAALQIVLVFIAMNSTVSHDEIIARLKQAKVDVMSGLERGVWKPEDVARKAGWFPEGI